MADPTPVDIKVRATDEATGVFQRVGMSLRNMEKEQRISGERSIERLLKGGGAIGMVGFAAEKFKAVTEEVLKLSEAYRSGQITGMQFASSVTSSIPVLGQFYDAINNINEILDENARKEAKRIKEYEFAAAQTFKEQKDYFSMIKLTTSLRNQEKLAELRGYNREVESAQQRHKETLKKIIEGEGKNGENAASKAAKEAETKRAAAELLQIYEKNQVSLEAIITKNLNTVEEINGMSAERRLRMQGKSGQAELNLIRRQMEQKTREIDRQFQKDLAEHPEWGESFLASVRDTENRKVREESGYQMEDVKLNALKSSLNYSKPSGSITGRMSGASAVARQQYISDTITNFNASNEKPMTVAQGNIMTSLLTKTTEGINRMLVVIEKNPYVRSIFNHSSGGAH
jgi:hypothetical protein